MPLLELWAGIATDNADYYMLINEWVWSMPRDCLLMPEVDMSSQSLDRNGALKPFLPETSPHESPHACLTNEANSQMWQMAIK